MRGSIVLLVALCVAACGDSRRGSDVDSGTPPPRDGGSPGFDGGSPGFDGGSPLDGGPPSLDAGHCVAETSALLCADFQDNDCDGVSDCNDPGCCPFVSCPVGTLCGSAPIDGGPRVDAAMRDAGPFDIDGGDSCPLAAGQLGNRCRSGTVCVSGVTCSPELTRDPLSGSTLNLRNAFGIQTAGAADPSHPGEYSVPVTPGVDVPIGFAPGGECTLACSTSDTSVCGVCSTCSNTLGGSPAFTAEGIGASTFSTVPTTAQPAICRRNCLYDPTTNGGCPSGYTCDPGENVCVEACTADSQCNLSWGLNRHAGLVAVVSGSSVCNTLTGACSWSDPGAEVGSACTDNSDCPAAGGLCLVGGMCVQQQLCGIADPSGTASLQPCDASSICLGFGGNAAAACVLGCNATTDCLAGNVCSALASPVGGFAGFCIGICAGDSECRSNERCQFGGFADPTIGTCKSFCTPSGDIAMAGAISCGTSQFCQPESGSTIGFCRDLDAVCTTDEQCFGTQACEVLADDAFGRCVTGCGADADCSGGRCRLQRYCVDGAGTRQGLCPTTGSCAAGTTCQTATRGVCRSAGGDCSPSATAGTLHGNLQCQSTQTCGSTTAGVIGACR